MLCVGLLLPAGCVLAGTQSYGARLDQARWEATGSRLQCTLSQRIPLYGTARFQWDSTAGLTFSVQVFRQPSKAGEAELAFIAPAWMHDVPAVDLGTVPVAVGDVPFHFGQPLARRLLTELAKGMYPTLTYRDWADGHDQVTVRIASIAVQAPLAKFLNCTTGLLAYGFDAVKHTDVYFASGAAAIDATAAAALDRVAAYLRADQTVREVKLAGYADSAGFRRYDRRLSKRRSEAVKNYLIDKGAGGVRFVIAGLGEVRSRGARRRAENHRVVVTLVK